jgi:hypothetical protein
LTPRASWKARTHEQLLDRTPKGRVGEFRAVRRDEYETQAVTDR